MRLGRRLHMAAAWAVAGPATVVLATVAVTSSAIRRSPLPALWVARLWGRMCLALTGCRLTIEGRQQLMLDHGYVLMTNHQSALDIPVLLAAVPTSLEPVIWAKESLFRVPFLGQGMHAMGCVPIDRSDRSSAASMLAHSLRLAAAGRSLLIFPEETYSDGIHLLPFQRGGFLLALRSGLPILPIGVEGTSRALPPGGRIFHPTPLAVRFGAPIPTAGLGVADRRDLEARVRSAIAELSRLRAD